MTEEEIERNALAILLPMPDVAAVRRRLNLSQAPFAKRFGFSVATVRNWQPGRVLADGPARVLLAVIANEPQAVIRALRPVAPLRGPKSRKKAA
jgi:putative transcriptional regulator